MRTFTFLSCFLVFSSYSRNPFFFEDIVSVPTPVIHKTPELKALSACGNKSVAIIQDVDETFIVSEGEQMGAWRVKKITKNAVLLVDGKKNEITLEN